VLWALLALPTLTVLIGAISSTISETVNSATLWIADHLSESTPGLRSLKRSAQKVKKVTEGGADEGGDHSSAKPEGFLVGAGDSHGNSSAATVLAHDTTSSSQHTGNEKSIPGATRSLLLLNEVRTILPHLDASPPRKYTYTEWTCILSLLGCDENSLKHHHTAEEVYKDELPATKQNDDDASGKDGDVPDVVNEHWSWLGRRSPLMSGMDEPRWVLEHLMRAMEDELRKMGGDEGIAMEMIDSVARRDV
jgi:potassium channel subfamily K